MIVIAETGLFGGAIYFYWNDVNKRAKRERAAGEVRVGRSRIGNGRLRACRADFL